MSGNRAVKAFFIAVLSVGLMAMSAHAASYQQIEVSNGGSINGQVTFTGDKPPVVRYKIAKDFGACGKGDRIFDWVKTSGKGLADVVIFFEPKTMKKGKKWNPKGKYNIDQNKCAFRPLFQVMPNLNTLDIKNSDAVMHNIHTYELIPTRRKVNRKTVMNVSQPSIGTLSKQVRLKKGSLLKVECDAHDFMHANIFVPHNPYYALGDAKGNYKIDQIPPGKYRVSAWHPYLGFVTLKKVIVKAGANSKINFKFVGP